MSKPFANENDTMLLRRVMLCGWLLLLVLAGGGWWLVDSDFAHSVVVGGVLVNASFWLMAKDAKRLLLRVSQSEAGMAVQTEKTRFVLRTLARLVVLGLLVFVAATKVPVNVIGLTLGFATVMVSVVIIGLGAGKCWVPSKA